MAEAPQPASETNQQLADSSAGGKVIRGSAMRSGSFLAQLLLSLIAVPLMVRHLGPVDYGRYVTVSSIVFIIAGFTEGGLTNLGVRHYVARRGEERARYLRNLTGLRLVLTVTGVLAAIAFTWLTDADSTIVLGTAISGLGTLFLLTQATYTVPLTAELRFAALSALELFRQAVLTGFIVLFVATSAGLVPFFWASVGSGAAVLLATLLMVRRELDSLLPAFDLSIWRKVAHEVLPYGIAAAVGLIYFRVAIVLMSYIATPYETGIYSTAFRIVEVATTIPWITVSAAFPLLVHAAEHDSERMRYALQRMLETSTIVGTGFALAIGLGASFAIDVVAGPGFEDAVPVLQLQGLALITCFVVATWSFALLSIQAFRPLLYANLVATAAAIAGTLLLVPPMGAEGAAIATVAGEAVLALGYVIALLRHDRSLAPRLAFVPKVLAAAAIGAAAALLPLHAVAQTLIGVAAFGLVLHLLRALPMEILDALRRRGA